MILDHIEPIELSDDDIRKFFNEMRSLRYLSVGLDYLYRQVAKIEGHVRSPIDPSVVTFSMGNDPNAHIPRDVRDLVAASFHWYAVSACNYIRMVGWIWKQVNPKAPGPLKYVEAVAHDLKTWRDKVGAHFAKHAGSYHDNDAEREASVIYAVAFLDDSFVAPPMTVRLRRSGKATSSQALRPWRLTKVHEELRKRYWPANEQPLDTDESASTHRVVIHPSAAKHAFDLYVKHYVKGDVKAWSIEHQVGLYDAAEKAFDDPSDSSHFARIYNALRGYWKVFRGTKGCWGLQRTFDELMKLPQTLRGRRLSQLQEDEWRSVWDCIYRLREIKPNKHGPSLTAISKFLHFWNPRLFVIFDSEAMDSWAFAHKWVRAQMPSENDVAHLHGDHLPKEKNLVRYLRVLRFASDLIKGNTHVMPFFVSTVRANAGDIEIPEDIASYEATAVEWCLLGLVELPPAGVTRGPEAGEST